MFSLRPLRRLTDVTVYLAGIILCGMMIHVTADVVLKYLINRPIAGTLEIVSSYYMVAGVFLPIAAVELTRSSIAVDVAYQFMPRWMQAISMALVLSGSAVVYFVLTWSSWGDAMRSYSIGEVMMGTVYVSVWPSRFVLPVSFGLAGIVCTYYLIALFVSPGIRESLLSLNEPEEAA